MLRDHLDRLSLGLLFATTVVFQALATRAQTKTTAYLNPPPEFIERFTFGFSESAADSLWLRWIQDGDRCQTYANVAPTSVEVDPSMAEDYQNPRHRVCDTSWSFKMLDAVTKVAPRFKMPYLAGAMTLSVLVEDYAGSSEIFDRGVAAYPKDWQILYKAGYHALFDARDPARAAELLERAADNGGPYWTRFLAAKMYSRAGRAGLGIATLEAYLKTLTDEKQRRPVEERLATLKRELGDAPAPQEP